MRFLKYIIRSFAVLRTVLESITTRCFFFIIIAAAEFSLDRNLRSKFSTTASSSTSSYTATSSTSEVKSAISFFFSVLKSTRLEGTKFEFLLRSSC